MIARAAQCGAFVLLLLIVSMTALGQERQNVVIFEVTEPGFIFDGPSIYDAKFESTTRAPLVVEPFSVQGSFGPLSRYYVHGLKGESIIISAPGHESKVVNTAGQTFIDVWLGKSGEAPRPISSRYWYPLTFSSNSAPTATTFRDDSDLFLAYADVAFGQIMVARVDRPPVSVNQTSPTGASITAFRNRLYIAWQGTGNRFLNVMSSGDGTIWDNKVTLPETTNLRPSIAAYGSQLVLAWIGTDNRLNVLFSSDGVTWGNKQTFDDQSETSPALLSVNEKLYLSWFGYRNRTLNVAQWTGAGYTKFGSADTSNEAPTLSMVSGDLVVCWAGSGNLNVNTMSVNTSQLGFGEKRTFALKSVRSPVVISYRWPETPGGGRALPLFVYSEGAASHAVRYWSDLNAQPAVQESGSLYPRYMVVSLVYAPPGSGGSWPKGSVEYGTNSQLGTTLSISNSFKYDNKLTTSGSFGDVVSVGGSFGITTSTQDQVTNEVRVTSSTGMKYTGPSTDGINHDLDYFILWLNPKVRFGVLTNGLQWSLGTKDDAAPSTQVVYVAWLRNQGALMPPDVFRTLAAAGITPAEYPKLLALNPFAAEKEPALDPGRFVTTNTTFPYEPPATRDAVPPTFSYTQSTSSTLTSSQTQEQSYSVGLSLSAGFNLGIVKASLKDEQTWTWTNRSSASRTTSDSQTATVTVAGPSYNYTGPTQYAVYWDALYRAFVFVPYSPSLGAGQQKPGQRVTTVTGTVVDGARSVFLREVILRDSNGVKHRTFSDSKGSFRFDNIPTGAAQLVSGTVQTAISIAEAGSQVVLEVPKEPGAAGPGNDFNRDGHADILWQLPGTGELWVWFMKGTARISDAKVSDPTPWRVAGTGDFNRDGQTDILWQLPGTGELWVWFMNGTTRTSDAKISDPTPWRVAGTGDFNRDGHTDILWQLPSNGELWVWFMNGTARTSDAKISDPTPWRVAGSGDFNRDGHTDILWQLPSNGELWVWFMNGTARTSDAKISDPTPWRVAGSGLAAPAPVPAYSAIARLRHVNTDCNLHSHVFVYGHLQSSRQQQVTCFAGRDENDDWMIKGPHGTANEYRRGEPLRHGDIVRLEHRLTKRNLHSHAVHPSPVTRQQEVSAFGANGTGDGGDNWRVEIPAGGTLGYSVRFRLIHVDTGHALHSHAGYSHPQWTRGQQEVTAFAGRDDNDLWTIPE